MATASKKQKPAGPATRGLRVVSKSPLGTLRRAGLVFGAEAQIVALSDITAEQAEAITGEPLLDVIEVDVAAEPAKD